MSGYGIRNYVSILTDLNEQFQCKSDDWVIGGQPCNSTGLHEPDLYSPAE